MNLPMPRPFLVALVALLAIPITGRGDELPTPSPKVKAVLDEATKKVRTNLEAFNKANEKPLAEARKELEDLSTKLIKDGKAEEAGVVLKQVGTLDADVLRMANAPVPVGGGRVVVRPQKPFMERLVGKWTTGAGNVAMTVELNGVAVYLTGEKGACRLLSPDAAELAWAKGGRWQLQFVGQDLLAVKRWDSKGNRTENELLERVE